MVGSWYVYRGNLPSFEHALWTNPRYEFFFGSLRVFLFFFFLPIVRTERGNALRDFPLRIVEENLWMEIKVARALPCVARRGPRGESRSVCGPRARTRARWGTHRGENEIAVAARNYERRLSRYVIASVIYRAPRPAIPIPTIDETVRGPNTWRKSTWKLSS